jgi:hypothetical protein
MFLVRYLPIPITSFGLCQINSSDQQVQLFVTQYDFALRVSGRRPIKISAF